MTLPLPLSPDFQQRFTRLDPDTGLLVPLSGGLIHFYEAGTTNDLDTYTNPTPTLHAHTNPVELDDEGRPIGGPIYLQPLGYTVSVCDADDVELYSIELVEDIGATFFNDLGVIQSEGTTATGSGPYTVVSTDNTVLVDTSTNPYIVQLPAAADRTFPLVIKNVSASVVVRVTPDSAETIDTIAAYYAVPAAVSPLMPTITLISDGVSGWLITGGIGL